MSARDIVAIVVSYGGVALLVLRSDVFRGASTLQGSADVLFSGLLYAIYLLLSSRLVHRVGAIRLASYVGLVACAAMVGQYAMVRGMTTLQQYSSEVYGYTMLMAGVSTVLPIVVTAEGIRRLGATHAAIIGAAGPVATIFLGAWFLGECITASQFAGASLVLAGVLWISTPSASRRIGA